MQQLARVRIHVEQVIGQAQKYKVVHNILPIYQLVQVSFGQRENKLHKFNRQNFICHRCMN